MENQVIQLHDFGFICRICLDKKENMMSIFNEILTPNSKTYSEMIKECASIHISNDDILPKNICIECSKCLERSYKLKIQCLSSEKRLQQVVENTTIQIQSKQLNTFEEIYDSFYKIEIEKPKSILEVTVKDEDIENPELNDNSHNLTLMKCLSCNQVFNNVQILKSHFIENVCCKVCMKECECSNNLLEHIKEHNTCGTCGKTFRYPAACVKHTQVHPEAKKPFLCTYCGKSFSQKGNLNIHIQIHTGEKPHHCKLCDAKFKDRTKLKNHLNKHTDERKYECDICKNTYKWKETLWQHKLSHTNEEFTCSFCDRRFNTKKNLRKHQMIHSGERKYICTYCSKPFNRRDNLRVHFRTHTGEKPFVCSKCGRGFSAKHVMIGHMKSCLKNINPS